MTYLNCIQEHKAIIDTWYMVLGHIVGMILSQLPSGFEDEFGDVTMGNPPLAELAWKRMGYLMQGGLIQYLSPKAREKISVPTVL